MTLLQEKPQLEPLGSLEIFATQIKQKYINWFVKMNAIIFTFHI